MEHFDGTTRIANINRRDRKEAYRIKVERRRIKGIDRVTAILDGLIPVLVILTVLHAIDVYFM